MNANNKPNSRRRGPVDGLLFGPARIVIDPKAELAAIRDGKSRYRGGVITINPFLVLPPELSGLSAKRLRQTVSTATDDLIKARKKEGHAKRKERKQQ